ncbi:hypothetical protein ABH917_002808 [Thermobifida halotolerans]
MSVLQHGLVREQVERLEHHADVTAQSGQGASFGGEWLAVQEDAAAVDGFQSVDRAAQRGLARSRGTDDDDHLAGVDGEIDVAKYVEFAEVLVDVLQHDERSIGHGIGT